MTSPAIAPLPERRLYFSLFARRLWGLALRHVYLHLGSWPRFVEMMYWPIINMLMWGFASIYLVKKLGGANTAVISDALVAGALLNELLLRVGINMLMLFLEEVWSRNLGHLFGSPLKISEYIFGLITICLVRTAIALTPAFLVAKWLFGFSILSLGSSLAMLVPLLALNGFWYGLLILALLLRYGLAAEWLAWMASWLLIPFIAPYYPVSVLPHAMQIISYSLPATYVFESMKSLINAHELHAENLFIALGLNLVYFAASAFVFWRAYQGARRRGGLLQTSE